MIIEAAGLSDVGRKRQANEDSYFLDPDLGFFGVADGMGGHQAGEVASELAVRTARQTMREFLDQGRRPPVMDASLSDEGQLLAACIHQANSSVHGKSTGSATKRGMGTTLSLILCTELTVVAANVGDSPIYLVRKENVELLSHTHTVEAELNMMEQGADSGNAMASAGRYHHMLTRAVGIQEEVEPSLAEVQTFNGDAVVICSDGLSNKVSPKEIGEIVGRNSPQEACHILVGLANGRGGEDNITVVVAKLTKAEKPLQKFFAFFAGLVGR